MRRINKNTYERRVRKEIRDCWKACQGMVEFDVKDSDRYWEMAERLMTLHQQRHGYTRIRRHLP